MRTSALKNEKHIFFITLIFRTVFFGEYESLGPGANYTYRASFGKQLMQYEAAPYMSISYIDGDDWLHHHQNILFGLPECRDRIFESGDKIFTQTY